MGQALALAEENIAAARPELTFFRPRDWLLHAPRPGAAEGAFEGAGGPAALTSVSFDVASDLYPNRPLARPPQAGPPRPPSSHHEALSTLILAEKAFVRTASSNAQKRTSALQVRPAGALLLLCALLEDAGACSSSAGRAAFTSCSRGSSAGRLCVLL